MSKFSKLLSVMLALVLTFGLISCGTDDGRNGSSTPDEPTKLTVKFEKDSLTMDEWDTQKIGVTVSDGSAVEVTVDDPTIAYLRGSKLTALKAGETTVTATAKSDPTVTAKMALKVNAKPESRPALSVSGDEELAIGASAKYSAVLSNADANAYTVNWSVNDKSLATISKDGTLTAKASGEVKVTATAVYCTAEFKAEKTVVISHEVKVIFAPGVSDVKLAVSTIKAVSGEYTLEIAGKTYVADSDGNITLNKADFDTTSTNVFEGKITEGANVHEFKLIVYVLDNPKAYQDGKALAPDENGYFKVDTTKAADTNGLRWVTFDDAAAMNAIGYDQLKVTLKFDKFCELYAGMIHNNIAGYHYSFGYKYTEKETGELVWTFWDNDYKGEGYWGAMKPSVGAPFGYGYVKIYDASGSLLLDYYNKTITDGSGTHGNWSDYIPSLETGKEYTFVWDTSKTGDITLSGIDGATITKIEWTKKVETQISFDETEISVDEWVETALNATVNDGSQITYSVSDSEVLYLNGNKIVGLKAGSAKVTATANGKTAELNVTVNAKEVNRPVLSIEVPAEIEIGKTATAKATLKCNNTEIASEKYTVVFESSDTQAIVVSDATLTPITAGSSSTITAKATYCGKEFTTTADVLAKDPPAPVDPSVGKLYQGGEELTPAEDGSYVMDSTKANKTLTIDSWEAKKAQGFKKVRLTVKFSAISDTNVELPLAGKCAFGYTYAYGDGTVKVGWWNAYNNGGVPSVYAGAFYDTTNPHYHAYLRVYNTSGEMIFEHYENIDGVGHDGWSSSYFGYIPSLLTDTEYVFEIDTEKTGDITLYGFDKATFTKIEWLDMKNTTVTFDKEEYTAEEWTAFNVKATTNDGSEVTYSVAENDEVLFIAGNKVIGVKAGESEVIATANGKTAKVKVVITENAENRPVLTVNENGNVKIKETLNVETTLKIKGATVPAADYAVEVAAENANVSVSGKVITGVTAGDSKITVTVTYCDVKFTAEFTVTVVDETIDPTIAKVYQTGKNITAKQLTADSNGIYRIDTTTDEAGENNLYWFSFGDIPEIDGTQYKYLRFKVRFANFLGKQAIEVDSGLPNYHYSFGYKYSVDARGGTYYHDAGTVHAFWDYKYNETSGAWGGGIIAGNAHEGTYLNIYKAADNTKIANCIAHEGGWTNYFEALTENTEYIFEFDMSKMKDFRFSAFAGLEITDVKWADTLLG